jgi:hypothetical protein
MAHLKTCGGTPVAEHWFIHMCQGFTFIFEDIAPGFYIF